MFYIKPLTQNMIRVYLHENCPFDIHYISKELLVEFDKGNGGEYTVQDDGSAIIAFF